MKRGCQAMLHNGHTLRIIVPGACIVVQYDSASINYKMTENIFAVQSGRRNIKI